MAPKNRQMRESVRKDAAASTKVAECSCRAQPRVRILQTVARQRANGAESR